jgi:lysophospholipase L1-like esterase
MAPKKRRRTSRDRRSSASTQLSQAAASGRERADEVVARRERERKARNRAIAKAEATRPQVAAAVPAGVRHAIAALGPFTSRGLLVAEGDSWFDYPLNDVLTKLEDEHGYEVESVAHKGDRVEDMAFTPGQLEGFSRLLEKTLQKGSIPKALLLSGGGNDIAGDEFGMLLNHARSPIAGLNEDVVAGVIDKRIAVSYAFIISAITAICEKYLSRPIPILVHGYDHPVPDGRGFLGGFGFLPGPWLRPGFREKGFEDQSANTETMKTLIDRFNTMVSRVAQGFAHVHYVDLRGTLPNDSTFKTFWANELHPTKRGFGLVAGKFAAVVDTLT